MKILVLCDQGNNRSVTLAHHLKYWDHDVLSAGLKTNSKSTLFFLMDWADRIITTDRDQQVPLRYLSKAQLWDLGPDVYPRPFNPDLKDKVRGLMQDHKEEYKHAAS